MPSLNNPLRRALHNGLRKPGDRPITNFVALNLTPLAAFFSDLGIGTNSSMTGRSGWTASGDATKAGKMKADGDIFRMNTGTNGGSPFGYQLTAAPSQYRRVSFGYDYSQQPQAALSNSAYPYQWYNQQWIIAWTDSSNYTYVQPASISAGKLQLRLQKVVSGVDTELTCRFSNVPWAGYAVFEFTDRIRLYVDGKLYVADQLYGDATAAFPDKLFASGTPAIRTGNTGLRHTFHPLALALDWKVEELALIVTDPKQFYGRNKTTNSRSITFSGTYTGTPVSWAYRLRLKATGATVKDWTTYAPTFGSGTFSGAIDVATGGAYLIDIAWVGADGFARSHTPIHFAVGILVVAYGQSNAVNLSGNGGNGAGYGGNDKLVGFNGNATYASSSWRRWMDELAPESIVLQPNMIGLSKVLSDLTGIPVGVAAMGFASNALATLKPGTANYTAFRNFCIEIGGYYEYVWWSQGEAEALSLSDYSTYASTDYPALVAAFEADGENRGILVFNSIVGSDTAATNNSTTTTRSTAVRKMLNDLANGTTVFTGHHSVGLAKVDGLHYTSTANTTRSKLVGYSIGKALGLVAYDGRGPLITSASRSGAVVTFEVDLNGASSLSGSALTGYELSNDDFATLLTQSSATVTANKIVVTLSGTPTGTVKARSFAPPNYTETSVATGTLPDGTVVAVFPILTPIVVT